MFKKALLVTCAGVGFAVITAVSILTQPREDDTAAVFASQIDANDLTLKTRNLPIQALMPEFDR